MSPRNAAQPMYFNWFGRDAELDREAIVEYLNEGCKTDHHGSFTSNNSQATAEEKRETSLLGSIRKAFRSAGAIFGGHPSSDTPKLQLPPLEEFRPQATHEISSEDARKLVGAVASATQFNGKTDASAEGATLNGKAVLEKFKVRSISTGEWEPIKNQVTVFVSADGSFIRLHFQRLRFISSKGGLNPQSNLHNLAYLDLEGVRGNFDLFFTHCWISALDLRNAQICALQLFNCVHRYSDISKGKFSSVIFKDCHALLHAEAYPDAEVQQHPSGRLMKPPVGAFIIASDARISLEFIVRQNAMPTLPDAYRDFVPDPFFDVFCIAADAIEVPLIRILGIRFGTGRLAVDRLPQSLQEFAIYHDVTSAYQKWFRNNYFQWVKDGDDERNPQPKHWALGRERAIDLWRAVADNVKIECTVSGLVDVSYAKVSQNLLIEGGEYRSIFTEWERAFPKVSEQLQKSRAEWSIKQELHSFHEVLKTLYDLCIDFSNASIGGILELSDLSRYWNDYVDGPLTTGRKPKSSTQRRQMRKRKKRALAQGLIKFDNSRCMVFNNDGSWWKSDPDCKLINRPRYSLKGFTYESIQNSWMEIGEVGPAAPQVSNAAAQSGLGETPDVGSRSQSTLQNPNLRLNEYSLIAREWLKGSMQWMELTSRTTGKKSGTRFNSQPWTQYAAVLRKMGRRMDAMEVLYDRELGVRGLEDINRFVVHLKFWSLFAGFVAAVALFSQFGHFYQLMFATGLSAIWVVGSRAARNLRQVQKLLLRFRKAASWFVDVFLHYTCGFGHFPGRAIMWSAIVILFGALCFESAIQRTLIRIKGEEQQPQLVTALFNAAPIGATQDATVRASQTFADEKRANSTSLLNSQYDSRPANYSGNPSSTVQSSTDGAAFSINKLPPTAFPAFNSLVYSLDVFIPMINFSQGDYWLPGRSSEYCATSNKCLVFNVPLLGKIEDVELKLLWVWYWLEVALGWLLVSIYILSISGFLEKKE